MKTRLLFFLCILAMPWQAISQGSCQPNFTQPCNWFIESASIFTVQDVVQNLFNGCGFGGGYQDFTNFEVQAETQGTVTIDISTFAVGYSYAVWVDWDDDGDFNNGVEFMTGNNSGFGDIQLNFVVPAFATAGAHTMRIMLLDENGSLDACGFFQRGEAEDYSLVVVGPPPCTNTSSSFSVAKCNSYTVPSGDETHTSSGNYMDTIPNAAGCDSVMTINVYIDETPSITHFTSRDVDQFRVRWEYLLPVTINDTNFRIRYWEQGSPASYSDKSQFPGNFQKKITGLTHNTWYDVKVGFACSDGSFVWGGTESIKTKKQPCATPMNTSQAAPMAPTTATTTWSDNGADEYKLRIRPLGGSSWNFATVADTTKTFGGLTAGSTYEYQVKARCGSLWSTYSLIDQLVTAAASAPGTEFRLATNEAVPLDFKVYPNPVNTGQTITAELSGVQTQIRVEVVDMSGRAVLERTYFNTDRIQMQMNLAKGIYHLRLFADEQGIGRKLTVR